MGSNDLEYGWDKGYFVLSHVKISREIELQQPNKNGDMFVREPHHLMGLFSKTDEDKEKENSDYENIDKVIYSNQKRVLTAKAGFGEGTRRSMYLGVPEDKSSNHDVKSRIEHLDLSIHEAESDDLVEIVRSGGFGYSEGVSELDLSGYPYAKFYVPSHVFDEIEHLMSQSDVDVQVAINRKGWHWLGDFGYYHFYLNTEEYDMAELAGIEISKKYKTEILDEEERVEVGAFSKNAIDANMHIYKKLSKLVHHMTSIKIATWVVALGVIYLAVSSYQ